MQATNLLKKVLKTRNVTPSPAQNSSKKENVSSRRSTPDSSRPRGTPSAATACTCSPTTHAGSFRCRLHRSGHQSPTHGLTPAAMPKREPKKPFKGSSSYTISSVDIHSSVAKPTIPKPPQAVPAAVPAARKKHRHKPSRLSRMVKATPVEGEEGKKLRSNSEKSASVELVPGFGEDESKGRKPARHQRIGRESAADMYAFDSALYAFEHSKGSPREIDPASPELASEPDISEAYNRLLVAQQTTDFISTSELNALYRENIKMGSEEPVDIVLQHQAQGDAEGKAAVAEIVDDQSKLYVEPLRIIDFKQQFLPKSTCTTFLVQWENLSVRDATWESSYFISAYPELLKDFLQRRSEQGDSIEFFRAMENVKSLKGIPSNVDQQQSPNQENEADQEETSGETGQDHEDHSKNRQAGEGQKSSEQNEGAELDEGQGDAAEYEDYTSDEVETDEF